MEGWVELEAEVEVSAVELAGDSHVDTEGVEDMATVEEAVEHSCLHQSIQIRYHMVFHPSNRLADPAISPINPQFNSHTLHRIHRHKQHHKPDRRPADTKITGKGTS